MTALEYAERLAPLMGLGDWYLIEGDPLAADSGNYSTIASTRGAKEAVLRLCPEWDSLTPATQRRVIVHELAHLYTDRLATWVRVWLEALAPAQKEMADLLLTEEAEYATDAIMRAFINFLPLPSDFEVRWEGTD